ncbi:MAG TPA: hypothetical protein VII40_14710 [Xanthobacteraceae bacterium]
MTHNSAAAGRRPRGPVIWARSVIGRVAAKGLSAAMVAGLCVGGAASGAPLAATEVDGRWVNVRQNLTLDISRCGEEWCGVEVRDGQCAKTALRLAAKKAQEEITAASFEGRLTLADRAEPYVVSATLYMRDGAVRLQLLGNPGDKLELWRRWYPFNELMARGGPSQCKPDAKVS